MPFDLIGFLFIVYALDTPKTDGHKAQARDRGTSEPRVDCARALAEPDTPSHSGSALEVKCRGSTRLGTSTVIRASDEDAETRVVSAGLLHIAGRKS